MSTAYDNLCSLSIFPNKNNVYCVKSGGKYYFKHADNFEYPTNALALKYVNCVFIFQNMVKYLTIGKKT